PLPVRLPREVVRAIPDWLRAHANRHGSRRPARGSALGRDPIRRSVAPGSIRARLLRDRDRRPVGVEIVLTPSPGYPDIDCATAYGAGVPPKQAAAGQGREVASARTG